jgi:4-hydroxyacetophenone monooxygenase
VDGERNPHAGVPFNDDDAVIAPMLEDLSAPALLCSLVHMTGDPSWIRDRTLPQPATSTSFQCGLSEDERAEVFRSALPAIAAYRDAGCEPVELSPELLRELMSFLAGETVPDRLAPMLFEDLQFDGVDPRAITWGDEIAADVKAAAPVMVIGCGQAGILAGIRLAQAGLPFTIVDKNDGPGGTWWENRYPGARVDVGSHQYCYPFRPADHWSEYYCRQPELRDYFAEVLDEHDLGPHCRFDTSVTRLVWDEDDGSWLVGLRTADGAEEEERARFVISAVGSLNIPHLPDIEGMDTFTGPSFHSSRWPEDLDVSGTRFALIGAGASGFQIAPAIAEEVEHLTVFQRTAQWMFPNPNYHEVVGPGVQWALRHLPFYGRWYRFLLFWPACDGGLAAARVDPAYDSSDGRAVSETNEFTRQMFTDWITSQIGEDHPDLLAKVIPDYPATGKRTLQDNGSWLQTLTRPDVDLVRTGIDHIEADAVVTEDGVRHEVDVIVFATGFQANRFLFPIEVVGRDGEVLAERWGDRPSAYLGITVPGFPNLFCMYGPGTNLAHGGSLIFHSECQMRYITGCLDLLLSSGATAMEPRQEVHDDYYRRVQEELKGLVWSHPSIQHSWFKNPDGDIHVLSPWRLVDYWTWTQRPDPEDFVVR